MKRFERIAIVLVVVWAVTATSHFYISHLVVPYVFSPGMFGEMSIRASLTQSALTLLQLAVTIALAIWIFRTARADDRSAWVWLLLTLVFGISAAILYFVLVVYERLRWPPTCKSCGYDLRTVVGDECSSCPECGTTVPPAAAAPHR